MTKNVKKNNDNRIYLDKKNILKLDMREQAKLIFDSIEAWKFSYPNIDIDSKLSLFSYDFVFPSENLGTLKGTYYSVLEEKPKYEVITYISIQNKHVFTMASATSHIYDIDGCIKENVEDWNGEFVNIDYLSYPINVFSDFISLLKRIENENYSDIILDVAELNIRDNKYYRVNYTDIDGSFRSVMMTNKGKVLDITVVVGTKTYILKNFKFDRKLPNYIHYVVGDDEFFDLEKLSLVE